MNKWTWRSSDHMVYQDPGCLTKEEAIERARSLLKEFRNCEFAEVGKAVYPDPLKCIPATPALDLLKEMNEEAESLFGEVAGYFDYCHEGEGYFIPSANEKEAKEEFSAFIEQWVKKYVEVNGWHVPSTEIILNDNDDES